MTIFPYRTHEHRYLFSGAPTNLESKPYGSAWAKSSKGPVHFATELDEAGSHPASPHAALWRAVIHRALLDATWEDPHPEWKLVGERLKQSQATRNARDWLKADTRDFFRVCWMANLDPNWVIRVRDQWYKRGGPPRDNSRDGNEAQATPGP